MRGLNFIIYIVAITFAVVAVPLIVPQYNNGAGMPLSPGFASEYARFQGWTMNSLSGQFGAFGNSASILDLAAMSVQIILICILGALLILSVAIYAYPVILTVAPFMPPVIGAAIQAIIWVAEVVAFVQVVRGVPWGLNE